MFSRGQSISWKVAAVLALVICPATLLAGPFDPATQFSAVANPNGVWSYGYEEFPLPNPFGLLTLAVPVTATPTFVDSWQLPAVGEVSVLHNGTPVSQLVTTGIDNALYQPNELAMHPGPNDQYGVVQFAAPAAGNYVIQGIFEGIDTTGLTNTDVDLLWNNLVVASGSVIGDGPGSDVPLSFGPVFLNAGDTLAFAVGGDPSHGTTALLPGAQITGVPEPSSTVLVGIGAISVLVVALRRWLRR